ncbi:MAG: hypothetical protein JNK60_23180, partial [Acidobacteria bacterium]|nr:hypothetical protein [Acidobacteriota bacterium]
AGLPLAGPFCVRVCGPCGAVVAITETGLVKLAREADTDTLPAGGAVRVPVWRFRFTLTDPSDGSSCASVSAVAARLAGAAASSEAGAVDTVDVAAHVPGAEPEASEAASREGAAFLPGKLSAEHAAEIFRLALAAQLPAGVLSTVPVERFAGLVLEGPLALETPRLVWR